MPLAIQYRRFSSEVQGKGDSTKRQSREFLDFCRRHDLTPWEEHHINDDGTSGWGGYNHRQGNLKDFVELVKSGSIPEGTVLVVENQDRLSRDKVNEVLGLFNDLVKGGVWIGDALTDRIVTREGMNDPLVLMGIILGAARANDYSESLSRRLKSSWKGRRETAAAKKIPITKHCPHWLTINDDRTGYVIDERHAPRIHAIFKHACEGASLTTIAHRLHDAGIFTHMGKMWQPSNISKIIKSRSVIGEYQPREQVGKDRYRPIGPPIKDYFPAVISQDDFDTANLLLAKKGVNRAGRDPSNKKKQVNLFRGLLRDARTKKTMHTRWVYGRDKTAIRMKLASEYLGDGQGLDSVDYQKFLDAFALNVEEINPDDFVEDSVKDDLAKATAKLEGIKAKVEKIRRRIDKEDEIDYLLDISRDLKTEQSRVEKEIAGMVHKVRNPIRQTVVELKTLIRTKPELVRAKMKLIVESIWCLIVMRGLEKFVTVQVHYRNGLVRKYHFTYMATRGMANGSIDYKSSTLLNGEHPVLDLRNWVEVQETYADAENRQYGTQ